MEYSLAVYNVFKCRLPFSRQYVGKLARENDFLLLQEWVSSLVPKEERFEVVNATFKLPLRREETGTATFSHFKIKNQTSAFSLSKELGVITHKSMILTTHDIHGESITIFNCHALNFVTNQVWEKTMNAWIKRLPKHGACIVAGDFNTWNPWRYDFLDSLLTKLGFKYAHYDHHLVMRLDHIWYREVQTISCVAHTNVHTSDHYPLFFKFRLE